MSSKKSCSGLLHIKHRSHEAKLSFTQERCGLQATAEHSKERTGVRCAVAMPQSLCSLALLSTGFLVFDC